MEQQINLSNYYLRKSEIDRLFGITNSNSDSDTIEALKDIIDGKSTVSYTQTGTGTVEIGKININGTEIAIKQRDNNTTYTKAANTPPADTTNGTVGTVNKYALEDHAHPKSNLYAEAGHDHDGTYLKSYTPPNGSTSQAGIVKLNTSTSSTSTTEAATPSAVKSAYDLANGKPSLGTTSTTAAKGDHTHNNYIQTSAIKNDLETGGATNVLSAEQGKELKSMIENITYVDNETATDHNHDDRYVKNNDSRLSDSRAPLFTEIPPSSDLNTYRTGGFYYCVSDPNSKTIKNCPKSKIPNDENYWANNKAFFLLIETWGASSEKYVKQTLTYYNDNTTFTRTKHNTTNDGKSADVGWTDWDQIVSASNGASEMIDNNSQANYYSNLGLTLEEGETGKTQQQINTAINDKIGILQGTKFIEITSTKPTASSETMNKLYIVSETVNNINQVNVYYTEKNGNSYTLKKMDTDILDNLPAASTNNPGIIQIGTGALQAAAGDHTHDTYLTNNDSRLTDSRNPLFNSISASSTETADLNTYRTGGFYYCDHINKSYYVRNCPDTEEALDENLPWSTNKPFFLLVETWGTSHNKYVKQTLTYYGSGATHIRTKSSSSYTEADRGWNKWKQIAITSDIPDISGKEDTSNKTDSWNSTTNDTRYPTEKLVKDSLDGKINTSAIKNNLTTGGTTNVLSAEQGKALKSLIDTSLPKLPDITDEGDLNNANTHGWCKVNYSNNYTISNLPSQITTTFFGILEIKKYTDNYISQTLYAMKKDDSTTQNIDESFIRIFYRKKAGGTWDTNWKEISTTDHTHTISDLNPTTKTLLIYYTDGSGPDTWNVVTK